MGGTRVDTVVYGNTFRELFNGTVTWKLAKKCAKLRNDNDNDKALSMLCDNNMYDNKTLLQKCRNGDRGNNR